MSALGCGLNGSSQHLLRRFFDSEIIIWHIQRSEFNA